MKYYGGVWCQTEALTALVTFMMTTGVIDEDTDSSITLADVKLLVNTFWQLIAKNTSSILNYVKGRGEESLLSMIKSWAGIAFIILIV